MDIDKTVSKLNIENENDFVTELKWEIQLIDKWKVKCGKRKVQSGNSMPLHGYLQTENPLSPFPYLSNENFDRNWLLTTTRALWCDLFYNEQLFLTGTLRRD